MVAESGELVIVGRPTEELTSGERLAIDAQARDGTNVLMAVCAMSAVESKELLDVIELLSRVMTDHIKGIEERKCVPALFIFTSASLLTGPHPLGLLQTPD